MSEQINLNKTFQDVSYISHLILESDSDKLSNVVQAEGYDIKNVTLSITLNGVFVRSEELESILKNWVDRMTEQRLKEMKVLENEIARLQTEEGLLDHARVGSEMDMCYKMIDKIDWNE